MCQAFEGEHRYLLACEALEREKRHRLDGAMARQDGAPRRDWERLVHTVDRTRPNAADRLWTPAWWLAQPYDGPLVQAWLDGWAEENCRIKAGGRPLSREERARIEEETRRLDWRRWDAREGKSFSAADVAWLCRMAGDEDAAQRYEKDPCARYDVKAAWVDTMANAAEDRLAAGAPSPSTTA